MTVTIQQETVGDYYISIRQEKYCSTYRVALAKRYGNSDVYHIINDQIYPTLSQAEARFSYLKRKVR